VAVLFMSVDDMMDARSPPILMHDSRAVVKMAG
jgi:hypothetical protein